ncbi:MAG: ABC transporter ATP-binding protein, partial [Alicyclobacillus sp.]|nr:ABC transporter ATP-binding protein [Alicyclobacillus sp.]
GEFMTFLGSSGSGKTTTLLSIAGFLQPSSGEILLGGESLAGKPPHKRNIGMVFQHYSLFPHMNVFANVAFPLKMRRVPKSEVKERVQQALKLVQLEGFHNRYPRELSGGQQQRVALARALVFEPNLLLMDEPLAALDKKLRSNMQVEIRRLHERLGITVIYVTHDQEEALVISDRIAIFHRGRIEQVGSPRELYERPNTRFVAGFLGESNLFEGKIAGRSGNTAEVACGGFRLCVKADSSWEMGQDAVVLVRPEKVQLRSVSRPESVNWMQGRVLECVYLGDSLRYTLILPTDQRIVVKSSLSDSKVRPLAEGDLVGVHWSPDDCVLCRPDAN